MTDASGAVLVWEGSAPEPGHDHRAAVPEHAGRALTAGRTEVIGPGDAPCDRADCPLRQGVVVPLIVAGHPEGALAVYAPQASTGLVRATTEVARWVSTQLELAEARPLARGRRGGGGAGAAGADFAALHLQRADRHRLLRPDRSGRARELLVEFAEFTRYSFRQPVSSPPSPTRWATSNVPTAGACPVRRPPSGPLRVAPEVLGVVVPSCPSSRWSRTRSGTAWTPAGLAATGDHGGGRRAGLCDQRGGRRHRDGPRGLPRP